MSEALAATGENDDSGGADDFLDLDAPRPTSRALARLGLIALAAAAATLLVSVVLAFIIAKSAALDLVVLITWLGVCIMSIGGVLLLGAAGIAKVVSAATTKADDHRR